MDWVVAELDDFNADWIRRFCNRKDKVEGIKRSMIEHLRVITGLPTTVKTQLLDAFENDQAFQDAFSNDSPTDYRLRGLSFLDGQPEDVRKAARGLFESSYDPHLCDGYSIHTDASHTVFTRAQFVSEFDSANSDVAVCPMCDDSRNGPDVDHFYPKSRYPFLACHPLNLVPICVACNRHKSSRNTLDLEADDPFADWFHPYLRSADGHYTVRWERETGRLVPTLHSHDPQTQKRLDNLQGLVSLRGRWTKRLRPIVSFVTRQVRDKIAAEDLEVLSQDEIRTYLQELADNLKNEYGLFANAILKRQYVQHVAQDSGVLEEFLIHARDKIEWQRERRERQRNRRRSGR